MVQKIFILLVLAAIGLATARAIKHTFGLLNGEAFKYDAVNDNLPYYQKFKEFLLK